MIWLLANWRAVLVAGLVAALGVQSWRLDRCQGKAAEIQRKFDGFVADTKRIGEQAEKEAHAEMLRNKLWKGLNDEKTNADLARLRLERDRLRNNRTGARGGLLPAAPSGASRPERACLDRADADRALREFEAGVEGLIAEGDEARVKLDGARRWAQGKP